MAHVEFVRDTVVPAEKAAAWWFDYQESDHMTHRHKPLYRGKGAARKIVSRTADKVVLVDHFGGPPATATVTRASPTKLRTVYASSGYGSDGHTEWVPKGAGSTMRMTFTSEWKGFGKLVGLFMGKSFGKLVREDVEFHVQEMEDEWRAKPW